MQKFGDQNLKMLEAIAAGTAGETWYAQGISEDSLALVVELTSEGLSPVAAAALFWYVRNCVALDAGFLEREDVLLVCYEHLISRPGPLFESTAAWLGVPFHPSMACHVVPGGRRAPDLLELPPQLRRRCDDLYAQMEAAAGGRSVT